MFKKEGLYSQLHSPVVVTAEPPEIEHLILLAPVADLIKMNAKMRGAAIFPWVSPLAVILCNPYDIYLNKFLLLARLFAPSEADTAPR